MQSLPTVQPNQVADLAPEEQKWVDGFGQGREPSDYI